MIRVPGPDLVTAPDKDSGALISWVPLVVTMELVTVRVPLEPWAIVYLLALSKLTVATERVPASGPVRGAVILPRKLAVPPVVGMPPCQLPAMPQLPLASTFHCGGPLLTTCRTKLVLSTSWVSER